MSPGPQTQKRGYLERGETRLELHQSRVGERWSVEYPEGCGSATFHVGPLVNGETVRLTHILCGYDFPGLWIVRLDSSE